MNLPVPIGQTQRRLAQVGRIRIGEKGGKQGRRAIDTFRFTAVKVDFLTPVAERYGGTIKPWSEDKSGDRFELRTNASEIDVILPPDPLTEGYELWEGGKGLRRRCDGETCTLQRPGPDGPETYDVPCRCYAEAKLACTYKLRLSVMLPAVQTVGIWRLDTSSEHARKEIPGMVDLIEMAQGRGLTNAKLRLEQRTLPGKRFNVPVLDPGVSIEALMAGDARLAVLPGPQAPHPPALARGEGVAEGDSRPPSAPSSDDEEIIEGEIVEHVDPTIALAMLDNLPTKRRNAALTRAREVALALGEPVPTNLASLTESVIDRIIGEFVDDE